MKVTLSVIKADIGGYVGHSSSHPDVIDQARRIMADVKKSGLVIDYHVTACGDDLQLILTHQQGVDGGKIHEKAWDIFTQCADVAKKLKLHGAGQDLLADAFSGNVRGMGPGVAEMEWGVERIAPSAVTFFADVQQAWAILKCDGYGYSLEVDVKHEILHIWEAKLGLAWGTLTKRV